MVTPRVLNLLLVSLSFLLENCLKKSCPSKNECFSECAVILNLGRISSSRFFSSFSFLSEGNDSKKGESVATTKCRPGIWRRGLFLKTGNIQGWVSGGWGQTPSSGAQRQDKGQRAQTEAEEAPAEPRKNFFPLRVTEPWPRLPREAVESPSLEIIPAPPGRGPVQPALGDPAWAGGWAG